MFESMMNFLMFANEIGRTHNVCKYQLPPLHGCRVNRKKNLQREPKKRFVIHHCGMTYSFCEMPRRIHGGFIDSDGHSYIGIHTVMGRWEND